MLDLCFTPSSFLLVQASILSKGEPVLLGRRTVLLIFVECSSSAPECEICSAGDRSPEWQPPARGRRRHLLLRGDALDETPGLAAGDG